MQKNYLESIKKQFEYYKMLGEKTFEQLEDKDLFWQSNTESNSIVIIVGHLWGNMKSRWTNFLTSDGEKTWRDRDAEFETIIQTKEELLDKWKEGWDCLFEALNSINEKNFDTTIYIRNQGHSIVEAINRQMAHYAYHIGQIVLLGKIIQKSNWKNLSIAKGQSKAFNQEKFLKEKHKAHFTDEFLRKDVE